MLFVIAAKFDMHDKLNVFSILISAPKILIHILATASSKKHWEFSVKREHKDSMCTWTMFYKYFISLWTKLYDNCCINISKSPQLRYNLYIFHQLDFDWWVRGKCSHYWQHCTNTKLRHHSTLIVLVLFMIGGRNTQAVIMNVTPYLFTYKCQT